MKKLMAGARHERNSLDRDGAKTEKLGEGFNGKRLKF